MGSLVRAYLRIGAIIHRVTADLLYLQHKYVLRYAVDNNDFEDYPVICTNSQMRPFGNPAKSGHADIQGFK
ncbi:MAG: hypothetical protein PHO37_08935 [Kiritimatiellae bacterium]|nr:hypothetical protein [Kiritimatiellia bacterium]